MASDDAVKLPAHILKSVNEHRPKCALFDEGKCKRSATCSKLHDQNHCQRNHARLPNVSMSRDSSGKVHLNVRPPFREAWCDFIKKNQCRDRIGPSQRLNHGKLVLHQLNFMQEPNILACVAAHTKGYVCLPATSQCKSRQAGKCEWREPCPAFLAHGATIQEALKVIRYGAITTSDGQCGVGVYCYKLEDESNDSIQAAFSRCSTGTDDDNDGAMFVLKTHNNMQVNCTGAEIVPEGVICIGKMKSNEGKLYSASPSAVTYKAVVFGVTGLVHALGDEMDSNGYPKVPCVRTLILVQCSSLSLYGLSVAACFPKVRCIRLAPFIC